MCDRGVLWKCNSEDAFSALHEKGTFLQAIRAHAGWPIDEYAALIVFTELVGNVARHSPGPVRITVLCDRERITIRVEDRCASFPLAPQLPCNSLSETGRGLFLVSRYATDLRIENATHGGKAVVATLRPKMVAV